MPRATVSALPLRERQCVVRKRQAVTKDRAPIDTGIRARLERTQGECTDRAPYRVNLTCHESRTQHV
jgi:hypothetical protein